jgi:hypothetical protein
MSCTVIVFSLLLLFRTGSQSNPPFQLLFFYLFYRWTLTCCGLIFNIHQVSQWISFLINFLPNFLYE